MAIEHIYLFGLTVLACMLCVSVQAREIYGNTNDPLSATVLNTEIHTADPDEMRFVILAKLMERYAIEHHIEVRRQEIDAYLASLRRVAENHRKQNEARREDLTLRLNTETLTEDERASLSSQLESLNKLMETLDEGMNASKEDPEAVRKDREQVAAAFIRQWKIDWALYKQYGGRIVLQQGGPEPLDAYRHFLEEQEKRGSFTILNKAFVAKFWDYYRNDTIHRFYPAGSLEEAQAFKKPWWLKDIPVEEP